MYPTCPDLFKGDGLIIVCHFVPDDGVTKLRHQVHKSFLPPIREGQMPGPTAGGHEERAAFREVKITVTDGVYADEVGAQVRHENKLARGIYDSSVGMWCLLTGRVRSRLGYLEQPSLN